MRVGERVRQLRAERGWTVRVLQDRTYDSTHRLVSQGVISKLETGIGEPSLPVLADIAAGFDLSTVELLAETVYASTVRAGDEAVMSCR